MMLILAKRNLHHFGSQDIVTLNPLPKSQFACNNFLLQQASGLGFLVCTINKQIHTHKATLWIYTLKSSTQPVQQGSVFNQKMGPPIFNPPFTLCIGQVKNGLLLYLALQAQIRKLIFTLEGELSSKNPIPPTFLASTELVFNSLNYFNRGLFILPNKTERLTKYSHHLQLYFLLSTSSKSKGL